MSIEYRRYAIPRPNSFLPNVIQVASFLEQASREWLLYHGWIAKGAEGMKLRREGATASQASNMLNELSPSGIRASFPFRWPSRKYAYDLEVHASVNDYVYHISETVAPFQSATCLKCGFRLDVDSGNDIFQELRIKAVCPNCGATFDPSTLSTTYTHWLTGAKSALPGGATYRLALIIGNVPEEEWESFMSDPSLMEISKQTFGCDFYEVVDIS